MSSQDDRVNNIQKRIEEVRNRVHSLSAATALSPGPSTPPPSFPSYIPPAQPYYSPSTAHNTTHQPAQQQHGGVPQQPDSFRHQGVKQASGYAESHGDAYSEVQTHKLEHQHQTIQKQLQQLQQQVSSQREILQAQFNQQQLMHQAHQKAEAAHPPQPQPRPAPKPRVQPPPQPHEDQSSASFEQMQQNLRKQMQLRSPSNETPNDARRHDTTQNASPRDTRNAAGRNLIAGLVNNFSGPQRSGQSLSPPRSPSTSSVRRQSSNAGAVSAEHMEPVMVSGAELFALLRLRGVIVSTGNTGEHLLPPTHVHQITLSQNEIQQLNGLRDALRQRGRSVPRNASDRRGRSPQSRSGTTGGASRTGTRTPEPARWR